jgi:hypothetical protein
VGTQTPIRSPDTDEALRFSFALMARRPEPMALNTGPSAFVVGILDAFLDGTKTHRAEKTFTWHSDHVQHFVAGFSRRSPRCSS